MKGLSICVALAFLPAAAGAAPPDNPKTMGEAGASNSDSPFGATARVTGKDLAAITGRADTALVVRADNTSNVSHNSVSGVSQTGTISFDERSFANLSGLSLLSANTGNNVSINSSLNLNVAIQR